MAEYKLTEEAFTGVVMDRDENRFLPALGEGVKCPARPVRWPRS
ncbi:hypothetical protein ACIQCD_07900 [Streptomyces sp. NPDC093250]